MAERVETTASPEVLASVAPPSPAGAATMHTLGRRVWSAVKANRGLVVTAVVLGVFEAFFTKAPFLLLDPLLRALAPGQESATDPQGAGTAFTEWFAVWFLGFAEQVGSWLGRTDASVGGPEMNVVIGVVLLTTAAGLVGGICIYGVQLTARFFAIKVVADLRAEIARHLLSLPLRWFGRKRMGELVSNVTNDAQVLQRAFELAADNVVVDPLMIVANFAVLALAMPEATVVLAVMLPLMAIPLYRSGRKVRRRSSKTLQAMGDTTESMNQILTGIRTVKAFRLEGRRLEDFEQNNRAFLQRTRRMLRTKGTSMAQSFVGYQIGFALLLLLLGWLVLVEDRPSSVVIVVTGLLATTYQHVKRLTRSYNTLMESASALERIEGILAEHPQDERGTHRMPELRGAIELQDVWFAYDEEPVLRGLDLRVEPGETIALVGPSGGGKSTTLDLLMRFHDPSRGRVLVDGVDLRDIHMDDYRRQTAVVSQQPFLFNTTIRENIACGRPDATDAEIEAAARAANIHEFILTLPQGYATLAGERGCNLSGGQMQRITIARAIVRDPAILFLDEATSALDSENEELVQRALDNLRRGRTSFVIAHRLSTVVSADRIVVLDQGRIVEIGTHQQLVAANGPYKQMLDKQKL